MALLRKLAVDKIWSLIGLKYLAITYNPISKMAINQREIKNFSIA